MYDFEPGFFPPEYPKIPIYRCPVCGEELNPSINRVFYLEKEERVVGCEYCVSLYKAEDCDDLLDKE